jgi:hypothetical protein
MIAILLALVLAQPPAATDTLAGVVVDASGGSVPGAVGGRTRNKKKQKAPPSRRPAPALCKCA